METKKTFDAVKIVRQIRDAHYEQLKDRTVKEQLAFYQGRSQALRNELKKKLQGHCEDE